MSAELNPVELLLELRSFGVELETRGRRLVMKGPRRALSRELRGQLRGRKRELVQVVKQLEAGGRLFHVRRPVERRRQSTAIM